MTDILNEKCDVIRPSDPDQTVKVAVICSTIDLFVIYHYVIITRHWGPFMISGLLLSGDKYSDIVGKIHWVQSQSISVRDPPSGTDPVLVVGEGAKLFVGGTDPVYFIHFLKNLMILKKFSSVGGGAARLEVPAPLTLPFKKFRTRLKHYCYFTYISRLNILIEDDGLVTGFKLLVEITPVQDFLYPIPEIFQKGAKDYRGEISV